MLKYIIRSKDRRRAIWKRKLLGTWIQKEDRLLDIGTGSGALTDLLRNEGFDLEGLDVVNRVTFGEMPKLYNGKKMPYSDKTFDFGMLFTVLHHCPHPEKVLKEAARVCKKGLFILEDVYTNKLMELLTKGMDSLVNMEFSGHPHTNKTEEEWEKVFKEMKLTIIEEKRMRVMVLFTQKWYVLYPQKPD